MKISLNIINFIYNLKGNVIEQYDNSKFKYRQYNRYGGHGFT
jgi:hypothetical protein